MTENAVDVFCSFCILCKIVSQLKIIYETARNITSLNSNQHYVTQAEHEH